MRFDYGATLLILVTGATLGAADHSYQSFRAPDPEEIYEAYTGGFIEYQEYLELLEIIRSDYLTAEDSAYLMRFPDLLVGFSSNPLFNAEDTLESIAPDIQRESGRWRQSFLFRQYARFDQDERRKQLYRLRGEYDRLIYYGELGNEYSGPYRWGRRYLQINLPSKSNIRRKVVIGNYKERFGLGLIYGYHGQLLTKPSDRADMQRFLYPPYGGGNGLLLLAEKPSGRIKLLYDTDCNESYSKHLAGFSMLFTPAAMNFEISALHGQLRRTGHNLSIGVFLASAFVHFKRKNFDAEGELAAAEKSGRIHPAAALRMKWRRGKVRINIDGWHYDVNYPAWFSGGPSSRRSHTLHLDEIGLSYSDRYSGETGLIAKTSYPVTRRLTFRSALGYARRAFDDDRMEARLGLSNGFGGGYSALIVCYWRDDHLYSDDRRQRRVQIEIIRRGDKTRSRLVLGHREDSYFRRKDFLAMAESRFMARWGTLTLLCKMEKLKPNNLQNQYLYLTAGYETALGRYFRSYIKYTCRYDRSRPNAVYRTLRLDIGWVME